MAAMVEPALEKVRVENVQLFTKMWLTLGPDCIAVATSSNLRAQVDEALGLVAHRWSRLLSMENQIPQDEATLKALERGRPPDADEEWAAQELIDRKNVAYRTRVANEREALASLKESVKKERRELESFTRR